jgi:hypothetical protein
MGINIAGHFREKPGWITIQSTTEFRCASYPPVIYLYELVNIIAHIESTCLFYVEIYKKNMPLLILRDYNSKINSFYKRAYN